MAKLRHIALAAEDPYATAEFYKKAFDFVEVRRTEPRGEGKSYGVFLSDGTISLAILRFGWDQGHGIAGVVLITAGYSADGKYSHYFVSQVPLKVGDFLLPPGQYLIGWVRQQDSLEVTFYQAQSGKAVGQVVATRNLSITRVESFRIWPPADKPLIQLGRFTFSYSLAEP